jgi:hypothetical protein
MLLDLKMEKTMIVGIMQPYFVPYIGYWQLLNAVDKYVIFDDVNYINRGWINRNRILLNNSPHYFNITMIGASQNKLINEIEINNDDKLVNKNLKMITGAYRKAPYYDNVYPLIEEIINCKEKNMASFISNSIYLICEYLDINSDIVISSMIDKNCNLKGQDKIIEICKLLKATEYYNAIGGRELYSKDKFENNGIKLKFLKTSNITYKQFNEKFNANLSIIDVMMFNSIDNIKEMLDMYVLV